VNGLKRAPRFIYVILGLILIAGFVIADTGTDTIDVDVEVASQVSIKVSPDYIRFWGMDPGTYQVNSTHFVIENIGSANITKIWASAATPTVDPFSTDDISDFRASNFIAIANETGEDGYLFVNRMEYNETLPSYVTPRTGSKANGRFRNSTYEYFWSLVPDPDDPTGNVTNGTLYIGNSPHTSTQQGTVDLNGADVTAVSLTGTGVNEIGGSHPLNNYCVIATQSGDNVKLQLFKWNADLDDGTNCNNFDYLYRGLLVPSNTTYITIAAYVPLGVPSGNITAGTITLTATDQ